MSLHFPPKNTLNIAPKHQSEFDSERGDIGEQSVEFKSFYKATGNLRCDDCDKSFDSQREFIQHMGDEHDEWMPYKCNLCSKQYWHRKSLMDHYKSRHEQKRKTGKYQCDVCKLCFNLQTDWMFHQAQTAHSSVLTVIEDQERNENSNDNKQNDIRLSYSLRNTDESRKSPIIHTGDESVELSSNHNQERDVNQDAEWKAKRNVMNMGMRMVTMSNTDTQSEHMNINDIETLYNVKQQLLRCDYCADRFDSQKEFVRHMKHYHNEWNPYRCPLCSEKYSVRKSLIAHIHEMH